ncbi:MAG: (2Fe-2S)-binding protein [Anaerolineae bacterium]|jgi:carbon-monoxide dehydrogenase small subunit|nr:(2Fe-2S)-binding protein [Anaerolineae bacterium]MDH7474953.1 (2Fe-2S)-binding protein [Anaerolineae bacterium]
MLLEMTLNSKPVSVEIEADDLLADVLRDRLGLIGTKIGCNEGECGACTVLVDGQAVLSCLYPALKAQGRRVETVEGLVADGELHILQQAFVEAGAVQCGFCTPGMLMAAKSLLDENPHPSEAEIKEAISGNLCRCTGYYQITRAIQRAAGEVTP